MQEYEIVIQWSDEDYAFIARAPKLPGCSAHGTTVDSALSSCEEAAELWIETARELGRALPNAT